MSDRLTATAESLRRAFDQTFREAPVERAEVEDFLAIRAGEDPYAIRLADVAGLHVDRMTVSCPSRAPGMLGIVALRGTVTPVYDLRALLGHPLGAPSRWLLLARAAEPVALAFDRFESYLRVSRREVISPAAEEHARRHVRGAVHSAGVARPIIDVKSILAVIARAADPTRER